jgi:hypothetical protein
VGAPSGSWKRPRHLEAAAHVAAASSSGAGVIVPIRCARFPQPADSGPPVRRDVVTNRRPGEDAVDGEAVLVRVLEGPPPWDGQCPVERATELVMEYAETAQDLWHQELDWLCAEVGLERRHWSALRERLKEMRAAAHTDAERERVDALINRNWRAYCLGCCAGAAEQEMQRILRIVRAAPKCSRARERVIAATARHRVARQQSDGPRSCAEAEAVAFVDDTSPLRHASVPLVPLRTRARTRGRSRAGCRRRSGNRAPPGDDPPGDSPRPALAGHRPAGVFA